MQCSGALTAEGFLLCMQSEGGEVKIVPFPKNAKTLTGNPWLATDNGKAKAKACKLASKLALGNDTGAQLSLIHI